MALTVGPFSMPGLLIYIISARWVQATGFHEAASALNGLMSGYNSSSGLWDLNNGNAEWWQSAIALQATLDFMIATDTRYYLPYARHTIDTQRAPVSWWPQGGGDFRAGSTDDTAWWALTLLSMYSITGEPLFLDIAIKDEEYMSKYWTAECSGGLIWQIQGLSYKAAISNELYLELTATLHNLFPSDNDYLRKSLEVWEWFKQSGLINSSFLVNDGLMHGQDDTCINNNAPTWTYNQGVVLGGLVQLYIATSDMEFLYTARRIADAVVGSLDFSPTGTLTEPCPAGECANLDSWSFKGIFIRYLAKLNVQFADRPYSTFILNNAGSIFANARTSNGSSLDFYGMRWQGPPGKITLGSQESAVMLLTAALG